MTRRPSGNLFGGGGGGGSATTIAGAASAGSAGSTDSAAAVTGIRHVNTTTQRRTIRGAYPEDHARFTRPDYRLHASWRHRDLMSQRTRILLVTDNELLAYAMTSAMIDRAEITFVLTPGEALA